MSAFKIILYVPFLLQALAIAVDEFYFHWKRGLPRWERVGHPMDTLSVVACYVFLLASPFDSLHLGWYIALCSFSCVFITKDEFVHQEHCSPGEAWLHAMLFVLHPLSFVAAGFLWSYGELAPFFQVQTAIIGCFLLYQIFFWSRPWVKSK